MIFNDAVKCILSYLQDLEKVNLDTNIQQKKNKGIYISLKEFVDW